MLVGVLAFARSLRVAVRWGAEVRELQQCGIEATGRVQGRPIAVVFSERRPHITLPKYTVDLAERGRGPEIRIERSGR